jgi:GNAT superfamily N-acetyltransferase
VSARVRPARREDLERLWQLIGEFAEYLGETHLLTGSAEGLQHHLFGDRWPRVECLVAEDGNEVVGFALYYPGLSTFWTRPFLWLEDLFVTPGRRGAGVGRALFAEVARIAVARGCARLGWAVLDINVPADGFYVGLDAERDRGFHSYHLDGEKLRAIAATAGPEG